MTQKLIDRLPPVRGRITENADIAATSWFRVGGPAEILFKPKDLDDLQQFLQEMPKDIPVSIFGVCSNVIIRDGGIRGVVLKFGRDFAALSHEAETGIVTVGAAALDMNLATYCADHGLGGLEFFSGIPGTIGGALRMNAGAYGGEAKDTLIDCMAINHRGELATFTPDQMSMSYRHNDLSDEWIFLSARFQTMRCTPAESHAKITEIKAKREASQPIRERTGGSTFANPSADDLRAANLPDDTKTWQLIDQAGGRGLKLGGAMMSEKHCNFMINTGTATAQDLEDLGEEIRQRVYDRFGIMLRWEIKRIGEKTHDTD